MIRAGSLTAPARIPDPNSRGPRGRPLDDQPLPWSTEEDVGGVRKVDLAASPQTKWISGHGDPRFQQKSPRYRGLSQWSIWMLQWARAVRSSSLEVSTFTPGPIVEDTVIDFM